MPISSTTIIYLNASLFLDDMDERKQAVSKELDSYLSERKKGENSWSSWFGGKTGAKPSLSGNVSVYEAPEAGAEKIETIAPDTTKMDSALAGEYADGQEHKSFFHTMLGKFRKQPTVEAQASIEAAFIADEGAIIHDIQELSRITLRVLKQLPPEELAEYKVSEDFATMKDILRKHKVIK